MVLMVVIVAISGRLVLFKVFVASFFCVLLMCQTLPFFLGVVCRFSAVISATCTCAI